MCLVHGSDGVVTYWWILSLKDLMPRNIPSLRLYGPTLTLQRSIGHLLRILQSQLRMSDFINDSYSALAKISDLTIVL